MTRSEKKIHANRRMDHWRILLHFYRLLHIPLWLVESRTYYNKINHSGHVPFGACSLFSLPGSRQSQSTTSCNARCYNLGFPN